MEGVVRFSIDGGSWGQIKILRPHPIGDDPWGVISPLQHTSWGKLIPSIPGDVFSHALHGYCRPFFDQIGPNPESLARILVREAEDDARCRLAQAKACMAITPYCKPGKKLPPCYEAPGEHSELASMVTLAWIEGRYVVVVDGPEFVG